MTIESGLRHLWETSPELTLSVLVFLVLLVLGSLHEIKSGRNVGEVGRNAVKVFGRVIVIPAIASILIGGVFVVVALIVLALIGSHGR